MQLIQILSVLKDDAAKVILARVIHYSSLAISYACDKLFKMFIRRLSDKMMAVRAVMRL